MSYMSKNSAGLGDEKAWRRFTTTDISRGSPLRYQNAKSGTQWYVKIKAFFFHGVAVTAISPRLSHNYLYGGFTNATGIFIFWLVI